MKNKKFDKTLSDKYAIVMYVLLMVMGGTMLIDSNLTSLIQNQYILIYKVMVALLVFMSLMCLIFTLLSKYNYERTGLCFLITVSALLFIEKTTVFCLCSPIRTISDYILYVSLTIFKLTFAIYRYLRIRKKIKEHQLHSDAVSSYRESLQRRDNAI